MAESVGGPVRAKASQQAKHIVIVPLRNRLLAADPGQDLVIALLQQRFIPIELRGIQRGQMALGEATEQQVAFQAASVPAPVQQSLAADDDRFGHHV